jgi:hypothetical protein
MTTLSGGRGGDALGTALRGLSWRRGARRPRNGSFGLKGPWRGADGVRAELLGASSTRSIYLIGWHGDGPARAVGTPLAKAGYSPLWVKSPCVIVDAGVCHRCMFACTTCPKAQKRRELKVDTTKLHIYGLSPNKSRGSDTLFFLYKPRHPVLHLRKKTKLYKNK